MTERSFRRRIWYTIVLTILFLAGKNIPLPWVETQGASRYANDVALYARMAFGTERNAGSFFALGIAPYISASIIMMFFRLMYRKEKRRISETSTKRATVALAVVIAAIQAATLLMQTTYRADVDLPLPVLHVLTAFELMVGSVCMILLMEVVKRVGIGGSEIMIGANILRGYTGSLSEGLFTADGTLTAAAVVYVPAALLAVLTTVLMDASEIRLPVQRISIHNAYAGDDYIAVKLHPAGTMPAMYAVSLISMPLYPLRILQTRFPGNALVQRLYDAFSIRSGAGLAVFLLLMVVLTFLLARLTIDPADIAKNLRENGDYLTGIRSGTVTERTLARTVTFAAACSAIVMCLVTGIPFAIRLYTGAENVLFTTSVTLMMLTGIMTRLMEEFRTERLLERYRSFL